MEIPQQDEGKPWPDGYKRIKSRSDYFEEDLVVIPTEVQLPSNTYDMLDEFILRHLFLLKIRYQLKS